MGRTLADLRKRADAIQQIVDDAIGRADPKDYPGESIAWGSLGCIAVEMDMLSPGEWMTAVISEASPDGCLKFCQYLQRALDVEGIQNVQVRAEW